MNFIQGMSSIFSLYIILNSFYMHHLSAKKVTLRKGTCSTYFERSVEDNTGLKTTAWSGTEGTDKEFCGICNSKDTAKSYLVTKSVNVAGYNSVHIEVGMFKAKCVVCKNQTIPVFVLSQPLPTNVKEAFEKLNQLTWIKTLVNKNLGYETHHFQFEIKQESSTIFIVFLSTGSCTQIRDIMISYFVCERNSSNGVILPETIAPSNGSERVNVNCPKNSINPGNEAAYGLCSSEGMWTIISPCMCKGGYTFDSSIGGCQKCQSNTYKDSVGNEQCTACPKNSESAEGEKQCQCKSNFYRFEGQNHTHACYEIPSPVENVKFIDRKDTSVSLQWEAPKTSQTTGQRVFYHIECHKCPSGKNSGPCVESCGKSVVFKPSQQNLIYTNVSIRGLTQDTEYEFVIYSKNNNSERINQTKWGKFVKKVKTAGSSESESLPLAVVIGVPVIVVVMLIIIIILAICLVKRRNTRRYRASQRLHGGDFPLIPGQKNYIDPSTYDNPERAVLEFAKELDRNCIKFEAIIGGGEFGDVYKGEIKLPGHPATKVAIKTLKAGSSRKSRTDFLIEASVMGQFKNLNVITLEGVVTKDHPLLIVTEFMEHGSLDKYLKENDGKLGAVQLLGMACGVANGMEYLAGMHFVHRDLAARNVLVNANLACKVADFGLSRDIGKTEESEYETQGGKIPVRWTAPEAITFRKFSTASDIWSYGILLWEIMSFAERPYWNWGNEEVIQRVDQGYRLPAPMNCPKTVHQLMKECWVSDRTKRPPFKEIVRIIDEWIKYPEKLNEDYIKVRRSEPLDYSTFTTVKDWLEAIKMGMYASNFSKAGYEELSAVAQLTEDELLKKVGVRLVGHRHKIYQRIKEMSEDMKLKREQSVRI